VRPERVASQSRQWVHHESATGVAPLSHSSASAVVASLTKYLAFGLPGGLMRLWMCPADETTIVTLPPARCALRKQSRHGVMWSVMPATA
jgi:hypothetical protein